MARVVPVKLFDETGDVSDLAWGIGVGVERLYAHIYSSANLRLRYRFGKDGYGGGQVRKGRVAWIGIKKGGVDGEGPTGFKAATPKTVVFTVAAVVTVGSIN